MKKYKLYVWEGVLADYTEGIMFAYAKSAEGAREVIIDKFKNSCWKGIGDRGLEELKKEPKVIDTTEGFFLIGGA